MSAVNSIGEGAQSNEVSARPTPAISIDDVSASEGNSGQTDFNFTVRSAVRAPRPSRWPTRRRTGRRRPPDPTTWRRRTRSPSPPVRRRRPSRSRSTATPPSSRTRASAVNLSGATNASIADAAGAGTILNDDIQPQISHLRRHGRRDELRHDELHVHVHLSNPSYQTVTVSRATQDGTRDRRRLRLRPAVGLDAQLLPGADAGPDHDRRQRGHEVRARRELPRRSSRRPRTPQSLTPPASARSRTTTRVPRRSSTTSRHTEGNSGTTAYIFTVALSNPSAQAVTVDYGTEDGTATSAGADYAATSGDADLHERPDRQDRHRQRQRRHAERGGRGLPPRSSPAPTNATIADATGVGTIQNDDATAGAFRERRDARGGQRRHVEHDLRRQPRRAPAVRR